VKVTLVPSSVGSDATGTYQYLSSYLLNDTVAIDAGSLGFFQCPKKQGRVKHVFVSHSHLDHIASLPIFLENAYDGSADCVTVHGSDAVLDCLRRDIMNDRVWPDFVRLSVQQAPFLKLDTLIPGQAVAVGDLRVTPVPVNHVVPTMGFLVEDKAAAIAFSSDTGPTEEIWRRANILPNLKVVFLEVTFPSSLAWLADESKHLTTATSAQEVRKLKPGVQIIAVHIKPRYCDEVVRELRALAIANLSIGKLGETYHF
jgi:ribonuclease BN (tRNA processing enzyme)